MMRRLLTKELKEKRTWIALLLVVLCAGTFLGMYALLFAGWVGWRMWQEQAMMPFIFIGLIAGLAAYSSELSRGRADFLMSRPVSWKKLLAAKVIAGVIGVAAAAALAGLAYWLSLPPEFRAAVPLTRIGAGVVFLTVYCSIGYLAGMVFSNVLPGVFGSALVLALVYFCGISTVMSFDIHKAKTLFWPGLAWLIAPLAATLVIARFGVTLQPMERLRRYGLACLIVAAVIAPLGFLISWPHEQKDSYGDSMWFSSQMWEDIQRQFADRVFPSDQVEPIYEQYFYDCRVSPDGSYAVYRQSSMENGMVIINLTTGKASGTEAGLWKRDSHGSNMSRWLSGNTLMLPLKNQICIATVDERVNIRERMIPIDVPKGQVIGAVWLSPDKQLALLRTTQDPASTVPGPPTSTTPQERVRTAYVLVNLVSGRSESMPVTLVTRAGGRSYLKLGVPPRSKWFTRSQLGWAVWTSESRAEFCAYGDVVRMAPPRTTP